MKCSSVEDRIQEYASRMHRVMDYIEHHLDQEMRLDELAGIAHFSPYHFHRLFRAYTGETLGRFISRLRLQKAAGQLLHNPEKNITGIALDCGFGSSASFSRAFRDCFGMSASDWRRSANDIDSNLDQRLSKEREAASESICYSGIIQSIPVWKITMNRNMNQNLLTVEVRELPERHLAYVRHIGPYVGDETLFKRLFEQICLWAGARSLINGNSEFFAVYHDDPEITKDEKLRVSVGVTVPEGTRGDSKVSVMRLDGGRYAVAHCRIAKSGEFLSAWKALCGEWLPQSGFQPDDRLCFEQYLNDPEQDPEGIIVVDMCVPVKPL
ncbi:MAG: DNA gyrase inhibitor [Verrucomicrobia bacterium ADurb.Bin474]|nr:MAG: DNA gyrase inhibitor [Verrucomicrobia bacterium ADurb.Bin474]